MTKLKEVDDAAKAVKVTFFNRPVAPAPTPEEAVAEEPVAADGDWLDEIMRTDANA